MMRLRKDIKRLAKQYGIDYAVLAAIVEVESAGHGFDAKTGKIIIQFEPHWFKRLYSNWRAHASKAWFFNKVETQPGEWKAFNSAFAINKDAAMQSTSIGLMQVMGLHYKRLGFTNVGAMWDFAKESEANQIELGLKFIQTDSRLLRAAKNKDWQNFAKFYNGAGYKTFKYDSRLQTAYNRHLNSN